MKDFNTVSKSLVDNQNELVQLEHKYEIEKKNLLEKIAVLQKQHDNYFKVDSKVADGAQCVSFEAKNFRILTKLLKFAIDTLNAGKLDDLLREDEHFIASYDSGFNQTEYRTIHVNYAPRYGEILGSITFDNSLYKQSKVDSKTVVAIISYLKYEYKQHTALSDENSKGLIPWTGIYWNKATNKKVVLYHDSSSNKWTYHNLSDDNTAEFPVVDSNIAQFEFLTDMNNCVKVPNYSIPEGLKFDDYVNVQTGNEVYAYIPKKLYNKVTN